MKTFTKQQIKDLLKQLSDKNIAWIYQFSEMEYIYRHLKKRSKTTTK